MRISVMLAICLVLLACNGEKRRLQSQLDVLENERASLAQRLEQRRNAVRDSSQRLETLSSQLTAYNSDVHSYIDSHRVASECIRASRSTWGENSAFSHDVSPTMRLGAVICNVALLNAQFAQEVANVTNKLSEADAHVRELKEQIATAERALTADRAEVEKSEASVNEIAAEIADVQRQLER